MSDSKDEKIAEDLKALADAVLNEIETDLKDEPSATHKKKENVYFENIQSINSEIAKLRKEILNFNETQVKLANNIHTLKAEKKSEPNKTVVLISVVFSAIMGFQIYMYLETMAQVKLLDETNQELLLALLENFDKYNNALDPSIEKINKLVQDLSSQLTEWGNDRISLFNSLEMLRGAITNFDKY